ANNILYWPDEAVEQLQVSMARKRPSETRAYQNYLREHGKPPKDYKEILEPIGPATGKWAGKQWAAQIPQQTPTPQQEAEKRFENMRVAGFGEDSQSETQKQINDNLAKFGLDPSKVLQKPPETVPPLDEVTQESTDAQEKLKEKRDTMQPQNTTHEEIEIEIKQQEEATAAKEDEEK